MSLTLHNKKISKSECVALTAALVDTMHMDVNPVLSMTFLRAISLYTLASLQ